MFTANLPEFFEIVAQLDLLYLVVMVDNIGNFFKYGRF